MPAIGILIRLLGFNSRMDVLALLASSRRCLLSVAANLCSPTSLSGLYREKCTLVTTLITGAPGQTLLLSTTVQQH